MVSLLIDYIDYTNTHKKTPFMNDLFLPVLTVKKESLRLTIEKAGMYFMLPKNTNF